MREKIIKFIAEYQAKYGYAPLVREIADKVGKTENYLKHSVIPAMIRDGLLVQDQEKRYRRLAKA